jgi:cation-dependent mannose-6-phosphate receptor
MHSSLFQNLAFAALAVQSGLAAAAPEETKPIIPCTAHSINTGSFYDLRPISLSLPDPDKKASKDARTESWRSKGYDYGTNFTMNICAPVLETVEDVVGIDKAQWQNVSAYYEKDGKKYSMG